jgi:hypothetical protein
MPTIHRAHGLRFVIFTDDHEPVHVHAIGAGGEAKIDLAGASGEARLVWAAGLSNALVRRALTEATRERNRFIGAWASIHGANDQ